MSMQRFSLFGRRLGVPVSAGGLGRGRSRSSMRPVARAPARPVMHRPKGERWSGGLSTGGASGESGHSGNWRRVGRWFRWRCRARCGRRVRWRWWRWWCRRAAGRRRAARRAVAPGALVEGARRWQPVVIGAAGGDFGRRGNGDGGRRWQSEFSCGSDTCTVGESFCYTYTPGTAGSTGRSASRRRPSARRRPRLAPACARARPPRRSAVRRSA